MEPLRRICLAAMVLTLGAAQARAGHSFKMSGGVGGDDIYTVEWDVLTEDLAGKEHKISDQLKLDSTGGAISREAALMALAASINNKTGNPNAAKFVPANGQAGSQPSVELSATYVGDSSMPVNNVTPAGFLTVSADVGIGPGRGVVIGFDPDLNTGLSVLTGPGSYTLTDAGGTVVSFSAPTGDTAAQLAALMGAALTAAGDSAVVQGTDVVLTSSVAGTVDFAPGGLGLDYSLRSVPEPSTIVLAGIASSIGLVARRRRLAVMRLA